MADNKKKKVTDASYGITNHNAIDVHVGKRIRLRRTLLGYSQEHLAHGLSLTFQQVQKYERGSNRVSASRLWDISYFFDDMSSSTQSNSPRQIAFSDSRIETEIHSNDPMAQRETLELVRTYYSVESPQLRKRIAEIVRAIAQTVTS
jgi:transcriptional regulator with XRE-family HTH domain